MTTSKKQRAQNLIKRLLTTSPLETRLQVSNEIAFINLLFDLGYVKKLENTKEDDELWSKIYTYAQQHTKLQIEQIEKWEKDGRPSKKN